MKSTTGSKGMKKLILVTIFTGFFYVSSGQANVASTDHDMDKTKNLLERMLRQNQSYITARGEKFFNNKGKGQAPSTTLLSCSDSRVHTSIIDETPEGNLFTVNNIGNQFDTAKGSIKYGINHLKTPLLLILGHSQCGAVSAALTDYSKLESSIVSELNQFRLKKGLSNIDGVKMNVHNQVDAALVQFKNKVDRHELLVVGAVYDFSNDMKKGAGKLNVINIQGKHLD